MTQQSNPQDLSAEQKAIEIRELQSLQKKFKDALKTPGADELRGELVSITFKKVSSSLDKIVKTGKLSDHDMDKLYACEDVLKKIGYDVPKYEIFREKPTVTPTHQDTAVKTWLQSQVTQLNKEARSQQTPLTPEQKKARMAEMMDSKRKLPRQSSRSNFSTLG